MRMHPRTLYSSSSLFFCFRQVDRCRQMDAEGEGETALPQVTLLSLQYCGASCLEKCSPCLWSPLLALELGAPERLPRDHCAVWCHRWFHSSCVGHVPVLLSFPQERKPTVDLCSLVAQCAALTVCSISWAQHYLPSVFKFISALSFCVYSQLRFFSWESRN